MATVLDATIDSPTKYSPLSGSAVAAAALTPFSALLFSMPGIIIAKPALLILPLIGIVVAGCGWASIRKSEGELGGRRLAVIAMCSHAVLFSAAAGWIAYLDRVVHSPGYHSISFATMKNSPENVAALVGQNVIIGGWMQPPRELYGHSQFALVDHLENNFGTDYKSHQQVLVLLRNGETFDYRSGYLMVTGRLEQFDHSLDCPAGDCPQYMIHADQIRLAPVSAELLAR